MISFATECCCERNVKREKRLKILRPQPRQKLPPSIPRENGLALFRAVAEPLRWGGGNGRRGGPYSRPQGQHARSHVSSLIVLNSWNTRPQNMNTNGALNLLSRYLWTLLWGPRCVRPDNPDITPRIIRPQAPIISQ